ncbi:MAG: 7-cyano-7-deazaguanine synthase QueC [Verrucomicrobia bacterium]|nr:7-cyano-7-deazaguanine synthase QueC [Verrucomicrobiota bacterium]
MKRAVVLVSGGMDSTTLLHYLKKTEGVDELHAISFLYGQKHSREIKMARKQAKKAGVKVHKTIDISPFKHLTTGSALTDRTEPIPELSKLSSEQRKQPPTYVPNRNMVFLSMAAAYAESVGIEELYYGAQLQDEYGYWDCSIDFLERMNHVLRLNHKKPIRVRAPFVGLRKAELLRMGMEMGVDYSDTWTCYHGNKKPCGTCPSCVERGKAFAEVGMADPV